MQINHSELTQKKIFLYSLGCAKNLVDGEYMSAICRDRGFQMTSQADDAEIIVVNTCGFIESAKQESIGAILDMAELKDSGHCELLIVSGCLSERYAEEMQADMPEVDAILGVRNYKDIVTSIEDHYKTASTADQHEGAFLSKIYRSKQREDGLAHMRMPVLHKPSTTHYAYLKIAEGCSNHCAFCAIPGIRGPFQSRKPEEILAEARDLVEAGYDELIVIAQDSGFYGLDLFRERRLAALLEELAKVEGLRWLRVLYLYAAGVNDELLEVYKNNPKVVPYFDIPIQHASDRILRAMDRSETTETLRQRFAKIRQELPEAVIRTTVMVGYPGESEADFAELTDFIREQKFEMLGCFSFCPEEGTKAFSMPDQVSETVKQERYEKVMELQREISHSHLQSFIGRTIEVKIEDVSPDGIYYLGRSAWQNPEVDSHILVLNQSEAEPVLGTRVMVRIIDADNYELTGVML